MKPIRLEMTAFGSFKNHTVIDFSNYEKEVFLITGDTGAGKTTIFDAITYGLFGKLSGSGKKSRTPDMMHTEQVSKGVDTVVELTFAHKGEVYRVVRTLHYKKKQKVENQYADKAEPNAVLYDSEGQACCSVSTKVTNKIEEILGITSDQFLKIVMLAQGEFKSFLTSPGDKKAEIIGTLFDSRKYEAYEKVFKFADQNLQNERSESEKKIKLIIENTFHKPDEARYSDELWLWSGEDDKLIGNLTSLIEDEKTEYEEVSRKISELSKLRDDLIREKNNAEINNNNLKDLAKCREELDELEAKKDEFSQKRFERDRIWKAWYDIHGLVTQLEDIQNRLDSEIENKLHFENKLRDITRELEQLNDEASQDEVLSSQEQSLGIEIDNLQKSLQKFESRDNERKRLDTLQKQRKDIEDEISNYNIKKQQTEQSLDSCKEKEKLLTDADTILMEKKRLVEQSEKMLADIKNLVKDRDSLLATEKDMKKVAAACVELSERCKKVDAELYDLQTRFYSGQAGILGEKLLADIEQKGSGICPVCRTLIHGENNNIVTRSLDVPGEEDVKAAEEKSKKANADFNERKNEYERYNAVTGEKKAELLKNMQKLFGDSAVGQALEDRYLENKAEAEEKRMQQAISEYKKAETGVKERERLEKDKEKYEAQLQNIEKDINTKNEELGKIKKNIAVSEEKIKGIEEYLKGDSAEEVENNIRSKKEKCKEIERILNDHKIRKEKLDEERNLNTGSLGKINEDIPKDEENKKAISRKLENKLIEDEFEKVEDAESLIKDIADVDRWVERRDDEIKRYDSTVQSKNDMLASLERRTKGCEYVELSVIDTKLENAKSEIDLVNSKWNDLNKLIDNHKSVLDTISGESKKLEHSRNAMKMLRSLSDKSNGVNTDGGKLSFSRYIMSSVFAEIVDHANDWLDIMTGGRYELVHVIETNHASSIAGFELEIRDVVLGTQRDAASLSGGESFLTSMSLALGLSDVVRSEAGGMDMEALFIDEGFGTLDEDVLTKVEEVLKTLKRNGNMVGIITHIGRLEMITDKIVEVHYDAVSGSTVKAL